MDERPMQLSDIIETKNVVPALKAANKKQLLQELAHHAAKRTGLDARVIFETVLQRERLLSTGLQGTAIPHEKFAGLDRIHGFFARLVTPIDFESDDEQPVDLVFLLLSPEGAGGDHLMALARVSRVFRDAQIVNKLRGTEDRAGLYAILTEPAASTPHAA
jgi:PTS system nitrogen regulatory IIA component